MIKHCPGCEQEFETNNPRRETCSDICKKRVYWRKKNNLPLSGKLKTRRKTARTPRACEYCGEIYTPFRARSRFCTELCGTKWHYEHENDVVRTRVCKECEKPFDYRRPGRLWYCSDECARIAAVRKRLKNAKDAARWRKEHPEAADKYHQKRKETHPEEVRSGITQRFFKRYPHIKPICQACGEKRIVELAHKKPRNGAWRTFKNTTDKDVWILCPTCHRCLDFGIQIREELGLPE